jgi:hypothetical protein
MFEKLIAAISGISALFIGLLAWLHKRDSNKLKAERDKALADAKQQGIKAEAKAHEAEQLREQQKHEGKINAKDSADTADHLDSMHKW